MSAFIRFAAIALTVIATPAMAYIGPGSGISLLGGIWTVVVGFVLALAAILIWPIRYMIRRMRARKSAGQPGPANEPANEPAAPTGDSESKP